MAITVNMRSKIIKAMSVEYLPDHASVLPLEFDLVISCGGFFGFYVIGIDRVLKKLERNGHFRVRRYAGSSVGAICCVLMCCGVPTTSLVEMYERLYRRSDYFLLLRKELLAILPPDAYLRCSSRVFIHATRVGLWCRPAVFSSYADNADLVDACLASSNFPFLISPLPVFSYHGKWYIDGCFTRSLPVFNDSSRQLLVKLYRINYPWLASLFPNDDSIEGLIVKGAVEADKFLCRSLEIPVFDWFHRDKKKKTRVGFGLALVSIIAMTAIWTSRRSSVCR